MKQEVPAVLWGEVGWFLYETILEVVVSFPSPIVRLLFGYCAGILGCYSQVSFST